MDAGLTSVIVHIADLMFERCAVAPARAQESSAHLRATPVARNEISCGNLQALTVRAKGCLKCTRRCGLAVAETVNQKVLASVISMDSKPCITGISSTCTIR